MGEVAKITRHKSGVELAIINHDENTKLVIPMGRVEITQTRRDSAILETDIDRGFQGFGGCPVESLVMDGVGQFDDGRIVRVHIRIEY